MYHQYPWFILAFLIATMLLLCLVPWAKRRLTTSLILFLISVGGLMIAAAFRTWSAEHENTFLYRYLRFPSLVLQGIATINIISVFAFQYLLKRIRLEPPPLVRDLILAAAYIVLAISVFSQADVNIAGLVTASAIVSAVIGFSLQDTLGNIMAGMGIQLERSIVVGDWIRFEGREGIVRETRWRQTSIETRDGDTILIPNAQLMRLPVTIVGRRVGQPRQHRQWVNFSVDYRFSPGRVIAAINDALSDPMPNVIREPPPYCVMTDLKDGTGAYGVCFWVADLSQVESSGSAIRERVYAALARNDIRLPTPGEADPAQRERQSRDESDRRFHLLRGISIFKPLSDQELRHLADCLRPAPFNPGETITRQGTSAHYLYILASGTAAVQLSGEQNQAQTVSTLVPGDFFGEMGLLTGEARSATVTAQSEVLCYRLDKESFTQIIKSRPEVVEGLSQMLATRRAQLDSARENLSEAARKARGQRSQHDLMHRIRRFFLSEHE